MLESNGTSFLSGQNGLIVIEQEITMRTNDCEGCNYCPSCIVFAKITFRRNCSVQTLVDDQITVV